METQNLKELFTALSKMQSELSLVLADSDNPFFKSKYADLAACWEVVRGPLTKNGLSIIQLPSGEVGKLTLTTILAHSSGQSISTSVPVNPLKNDPQAIGSAITYMRRYSLAAIIGLAQTDDDAESAMNRQQSQKPLTQQKSNQVNPDLISDDERSHLWDKMKTDLGFDKEKAQAFLKKVLKKESLKNLTKQELPLVLKAVEEEIFKIQNDQFMVK